MSDLFENVGNRAQNSFTQPYLWSFGKLHFAGCYVVAILKLIPTDNRQSSQILLDHKQKVIKSQLYHNLGSIDDNTTAILENVAHKDDFLEQ
jgi:hypothetical protein